MLQLFVKASENYSMTPARSESRHRNHRRQVAQMQGLLGRFPNMRFHSDGLKAAGEPPRSEARKGDDMFTDDQKERLNQWCNVYGGGEKCVAAAEADRTLQRLLRAEFESPDIDDVGRAIRQRITGIEVCHRRCKRNVEDILSMIGQMQPARVAGCGQADAELAEELRGIMSQVAAWTPARRQRFWARGRLPSSGWLLASARRWPSSLSLSQAVRRYPSLNGLLNENPNKCIHTDGKHCAAPLCSVPAGDAVVIQNTCLICRGIPLWSFPAFRPSTPG